MVGRENKGVLCGNSETRNAASNESETVLDSNSVAEKAKKLSRGRKNDGGSSAILVRTTQQSLRNEG